MQDTTIEFLADALERFGLQYLATIGLDGKPKVRPIQFMTLRDRKMWFCTNNKKSLYAELQSFPHVEICASSLETDQINSRWVRFSAEAVFPPQSELVSQVKKDIMEKSPIVHELYHDNPDNPIFVVFYQYCPK
ncbi:MAG: pyridoxamine 5'-phosphate oxidase family protein [Bacteroidales bacterium]|nr:pyridoxamine 5'-phosphate oxidase family protein [Bacteroidales bacterium]MDY6348008.1 pyridoxamine 5'-phosphate oxidase family protein [Bacteroidales bacterium]